MEDNSWLKVGSITLYLDDKQSILNGERLTGSQITVAQSLVKTQFPHFNGLEDTLLLFHEKRKCGPIFPETVQILHVDGNHWITVYSLGCKNGHSRNHHKYRVIQKLRLNIKTDPIYTVKEHLQCRRDLYTL